MTRVPVVGCMIRGEVILTPGIGPATDELSGFELLAASHAITTTARVATPSTSASLRIMGSHQVQGRLTAGARARMRAAAQRYLSAYRVETVERVDPRSG